MQPDKFTQKSQEAIAATLELARSHRNPEAAPAQAAPAAPAPGHGRLALVAEGVDHAAVRLARAAVNLPLAADEHVLGAVDRALRQAARRDDLAHHRVQRGPAGRGR